MKEFNENLLSAILDTTIFIEESPPPSVCNEIAEKLLALAQKGDTTATALYTLIAAFGNCGKAFDADLGCNLLFGCKDGFDAYQNIVIDALYTVIDDEDYHKIECFPILHTLEKMNKND